MLATGIANASTTRRDVLVGGATLTAALLAPTTTPAGARPANLHRRTKERP